MASAWLHEAPSGIQPRSSLHGMLGAVDALREQLNLDCPWSEVGHFLVGLLQRYSTGLTLEVAADELSTRLSARARSSTGPRFVFDGPLQSRLPAWALLPVDQDNTGPVKSTRMALCVHSSQTGILLPPGIVLRINTKALAADPAISHPRDVVGIEGADAKKFETVLLPTRCVVFEARVSPTVTNHATEQRKRSHEQPLDQPFPTDIEQLLEERTLLRVWDDRDLAPEWVSATIVAMSRNKIRLQDTARADSLLQPSVELMLQDDECGLQEVLNVGEALVISKPTVAPTSSSFSLGLSPSSTVYCVPVERPAVVGGDQKSVATKGTQSLEQDRAAGHLNCAQDSSHGTARSSSTTDASRDPRASSRVQTPPQKRRRSGLPAEDNAQLALSPRAITASDMFELTAPAMQKPFSMFSVIQSVSSDAGTSQSSRSAVHSSMLASDTVVSTKDSMDRHPQALKDRNTRVVLTLDGGVVLTLDRQSFNGVADIWPGDVVWIADLQFGSRSRTSPGSSASASWTASKVLNMSSMAGALATPFVRNLAPLRSVQTHRAQGPMTWNVKVCIEHRLPFEDCGRLVVVGADTTAPEACPTLVRPEGVAGAQSSVDTAEFVFEGTVLQTLLKTKPSNVEYAELRKKSSCRRTWLVGDFFLLAVSEEKTQSGNQSSMRFRVRTFVQARGQQ